MSDELKMIARNGSNFWYLNDELHREDGPAIEWADGGNEWWLNGKFHRIDGPAVEWADGTKRWYLNDVHYTEEEHYFQAMMRYANV